MQLTLILNQGEDNYWVGQIKELPEIISQGKNKQELIENIEDALDLYLEMKRAEYLKEFEGNIEEETLVFTKSA